MPSSSTSTRPALTRFYGIAGRFLCVQALDERSATLANNFFSEFHLALVRPQLAENIAFTIRMRCGGPLPLAPPGLEVFEVAYGHCYTDGTISYLYVEDSVVVIRPRASGVIDVYLGETQHAQHPVSLANVMSYALDAAMRRCGLYQLHGAGVVEPEKGVGALIMGGSGSGKSTLTIQLAAQGWGYLTDDALLLNEDAGEVVEARGLRRTFAAGEDALAAFALPRLKEALGNIVLTDPSKRRLDPKVVFPNRYVESCVPHRLFFASITGDAESRVTTLSASEAMTRLIKFNPWATYDALVAREHLRILGRLAKQCRAYTLDAGLDILNKPHRAVELLAPHMTGF